MAAAGKPSRGCCASRQTGCDVIARRIPAEVRGARCLRLVGRRSSLGYRLAQVSTARVAPLDRRCRGGTWAACTVSAAVRIWGCSTWMSECVAQCEQLSAAENRLPRFPLRQCPVEPRCASGTRAPTLPLCRFSATPWQGLAVGGVFPQSVR